MASLWLCQSALVLRFGGRLNAGHKLYTLKYLILLYLTFIIGCSSAQKYPPDDNLLNYSYKIQGINDHTKQYVNAGTGFIINHNGVDFLVSNYHVFTGKDAVTGQIVNGLTDTCTSIIVWFRGQVDTPFKKLVIPLYDSIGKLFSVYHADKEKLLDIAVMPLPRNDLPPGIKKYTISLSDVDTSTNSPENKRIYVVGFPVGYLKDGWKPKVVKANSVTQKVSGNFTIPNIFFDDTTSGGMSGSPTYIQTDETTKPLLVAINSMNTDFDSNNPKIKGGAYYFKYCWDIIKLIIKENRPGVDVYFQ